jgi:hypothetical protein
LCARYVAANSSKKILKWIWPSILCEEEYSMIRTFLEDLITKSNEDTDGNATRKFKFGKKLLHNLKDQNQKILVNLCKENLFGLYKLLKKIKLRFDHSNPIEFVNSQEELLPALLIQPPPAKRPRLENGSTSSDLVAGEFLESTPPESTALGFAIMRASEKFVLALIQDGADLKYLLQDDGRYKQTIWHAVNRGLDEVVPKILKIKSLGDVEGAQHLGLLHAAVRTQNVKILQTLVDEGADTNALDEETGDTPLKLARRIELMDKNIIAILESYGATSLEEDQFIEHPLVI